MSQANTEKRFHLLIELKDMFSPVLREVIVPAEINLGCLHHVIQVVMGWDNSHLHEFEHKGESYGRPEHDEYADIIDEDSVPLSDLFKRKGSRLTYTYDFGDDWVHEVSLLKTLPADSSAPFVYMGGEGACPPEDCGGPWGYEHLLELRQRQKEKGDEALDEDELQELEWLSNHKEELSKRHAKRVEKELKSIGNWVAESTKEFGEDDEGDEEEFNDFTEYMTEAARIIGVIEANDGLFDFDEEDEEDEEVEEIPEPYADLSADEAGAYAQTMQLATEIRKAEPWKHIYETDLFGIEDPETGELDIVSVLGAGKEIYVVQVYRPPSAIYFWKTAIGDAIRMTPDFLLEHCHMVQAEFLNKGKMEPHDLALYTQTGTDTPGKGRQGWIRFRSCRPRCLPWLGFPEDLPALERGLRLSERFSRESKQSPELLISRGGVELGLPDELPVFRLKGDQPEDPDAWALSMISVDWASVQPGSKVYHPTEFELAKLAQAPVREDLWELASVFLKSPIATERGPIIPVISVIAPHAQGAEAPIPHLDTELEHKPTQALWECLVETVEHYGYLPSEMHVSTEHSYETLLPLAKLAGIHLEQVECCKLVAPMLQILATIKAPE